VKQLLGLPTITLKKYNNFAFYKATKRKHSCKCSIKQTNERKTLTGFITSMTVDDFESTKLPPIRFGTL